MPVPSDEAASMPPIGAPVRRASEQVAATIQLHIHRNGLQPGTRLGTVDELAQSFGVSRPTLREALTLLAGGHLVRSTKGPGGGVFVASTPEQGMRTGLSAAIAAMLDTESMSLEELLEARRLLEPPLARRAAERADEATKDELRAALALADADPESETAQRESDLRIHRALANAAGSRLVATITDWAFEVLEPRLKAFVGSHVDDGEIRVQHRRLVEAVERGDPDEAEQALLAHLRYVVEAVARVRATR